MGATPSCEKLLQSASLDRSASRTLEQLWRACVDKPADASAWESFLALTSCNITAVVRRVAMRAGLAAVDTLIEDTFQEICLKISQISPNLPKGVLDSEATAQAYLRALAANAAKDAIKARFAICRNAQVTISLEDRDWELRDALRVDSLERSILFGQIDTAMDCSARDRSIFWLYFRHGFTSEEIARIPAFELTPKGVESLLSRLTTRLREHFRDKKPLATGAEGGRSR